MVDGVKVDPEKLAAMKEWPSPTIVKSLRGLLGLIGYYRRFIKCYGSIAAPLTQLLKKNRFKWVEETEEAFLKLKYEVTQPLILVLPNFSLQFVIECDDSRGTVGAMLMQKNKPITS